MASQRIPKLKPSNVLLNRINHLTINFDSSADRTIEKCITRMEQATARAREQFAGLAYTVDRWQPTTEHSAMRQGMAMEVIQLRRHRRQRIWALDNGEILELPDTH